MSLLNKRSCSADVAYRPAILAGLYFFAAGVFPVHSYEHSSLHQFEPLLADEPFRLSDLPDSAQVNFGTTFAPLYSAKDRATGGDSDRVSLRAHGISGGFYAGSGPLRYFLSCSNGDVDAIYRKRDEDYYLVNKRQDWNVAGGAAYRHGALLVGVGLGRHLPNTMQREHLRDIREDPGSYLHRSAWQFAFDLKADFAKAAGRLSLFSGPVHSSVTQLYTSDATSFRSFPLFIVKHSVDAEIDIRPGIQSVSSTFGIDYFENADLLTAPNSMPQDVALRNYRFELRGILRLPCTDSLGWNLSRSTAGGWAASYNFDRDRLTFFKSEALRLKYFHAGIGAKLPGAMTAGISGTDLQGTTPSGFLKLSALSAWSLFKSLDYRYTDAEMTYHEAGALINRKFEFSAFEIVPQLYASFIAAKMGLRYSHKEIVVLLPVYRDNVTREVFNTRLLLFEPSLTVVARIGRIGVTGSVHQELPVVVAPKKTPAPGSPAEPTEPVGQLKTTDNIVTGGTRLSLSAVVRISARRK